MGADVLLTCRSPCPIVSSNPLLLSGLYSPADADHHAVSDRRLQSSQARREYRITDRDSHAATQGIGQGRRATSNTRSEELWPGQPAAAENEKAKRRYRAASIGSEQPHVLASWSFGLMGFQLKD